MQCGHIVDVLSGSVPILSSWTSVGSVSSRAWYANLYAVSDSSVCCEMCLLLSVQLE